MNPGRELDALIAEKVMGLKEVKTKEEYLKLQEEGGDYFRKKYFCSVALWNETFSMHRPAKTIHPPKEFSTRIEDAWEVVEKLKNLVKGIVTIQENEDAWSVGWGEYVSFEGFSFHEEFLSESAPHAICLAALKALGIETEKE